MARKLYAIALVFLSSFVLANDAPYFLSITPQKGDGIWSLMRKYKLDKFDCNLEKFLALNELEGNSILRTDIEYKLPIYIYPYNGKSIRSTIGDNDYNKAVRIKRYNETIKSNGLRRTHYTASKILWVPFHEISCDSTPKKATSKSNSQLKPAPKAPTSTKSLFGSKYSNFKVLDNSLKNKVFYLTAGHGGPDPGARCLNCPKTMCEDEYAYDIVLRLARNLMQHGAKVHVIIEDLNDGIRDEEDLVCDKDETCNGQTIPLPQKKRLVQRAARINALYRSYKKQGISSKNQIALFVHIDSNGPNKRRDVYFYHHKNSKSGKKLAKRVQNTFKKKYAQYQKTRGYGGSVSSRGLYVLNYTQPTSLFVELANIQNIKDHARIKRPENRQALANWLFDGIIK